jgi:hypothetical protein
MARTKNTMSIKFQAKNKDKIDGTDAIYSVRLETDNLDIFNERLKYYFKDYVKMNQVTIVVIKDKIEFRNAINDFLETTKYALKEVKTINDEIHYYIIKVKSETS